MKNKVNKETLEQVAKGLNLAYLPWLKEKRPKKVIRLLEKFGVTDVTFIISGSGNLNGVFFRMLERSAVSDENIFFQVYGFTYDGVYVTAVLFYPNEKQTVGYLTKGTSIDAISIPETEFYNFSKINFFSPTKLKAIL